MKISPIKNEILKNAPKINGLSVSNNSYEQMNSKNTDNAHRKELLGSIGQTEPIRYKIDTLQNIKFQNELDIAKKHDNNLIVQKNIFIADPEFVSTRLGNFDKVVLQKITDPVTKKDSFNFIDYCWSPDDNGKIPLFKWKGEFNAVVDDGDQNGSGRKPFRTKVQVQVQV